MPYSYNKLRGKIIEVFGSQREFAKAVGISENSMSKKMNGVTEFSQADIIKWSELLHIDRQDYSEYFFA